MSEYALLMGITRNSGSVTGRGAGSQQPTSDSSPLHAAVSGDVEARQTPD